MDDAQLHYFSLEGEAAGDFVLNRLTDEDRVLAKSILKSKGHLGLLGMVEVGIVLGRLKLEQKEALIELARLGQEIENG